MSVTVFVSVCVCVCVYVHCVQQCIMWIFPSNDNVAMSETINFFGALCAMEADVSCDGVISDKCRER